MGDRLMFHQIPVGDTETAGDVVDQALKIAWIASELAIDVFGMLFWSALGLCFLRVVTQA